MTRIPVDCPTNLKEPAANEGGRAWLFRGGAILLAPIILSLLEGVLAGLGWSPVREMEDPWVGFSGVRPLFRLSEDATRYEIAPERHKFFIAESFPAHKSPETFRVFCLGGSTVQGRPYSTATSFTRWLQVSLEAVAPQRTWEVINCGGISYASYRLIPILEECLNYRPDLFIIATGHNEFLEDRSYPAQKRWAKYMSRPHQWAAKLRSFQWIESGWRQWVTPSNPTENASNLILPEEVEARLDYRDGLQAYHRDDAWHAAVADHFRANLSWMIQRSRRAGIPLVLVRLPSNLSDCPPFKSEPSAGLSREQTATWQQWMKRAQRYYQDNPWQAIEYLKRALEIDPRYAATYFELGHCYLVTGQGELAKAAFRRARDEDVCPLRSPRAIESAFLETVEATRAAWIDADELLARECRENILGEPLMIDHVHPTLYGHQLIANALVIKMAQLGFLELGVDWKDQRQAAYDRHWRNLDPLYFEHGRRTLNQVRGWTRGRARTPFVRNGNGLEQISDTSP